MAWSCKSYDNNLWIYRSQTKNFYAPNNNSMNEPPTGDEQHEGGIWPFDILLWEILPHPWRDISWQYFSEWGARQKVNPGHGHNEHTPWDDGRLTIARHEMNNQGLCCYNEEPDKHKHLLAVIPAPTSTPPIKNNHHSTLDRIQLNKESYNFIS